MSNPTMVEVKASGQEIADLAKKMAEVMQDEEPSKAYMACLFLATIYMNPDTNPDGIQFMIRETSRYMHLLDMPTDGETPNTKMN